VEIKISSTPVFNFKLTIHQIQLLRGLSKNHYDATCREAYAVGGFMYGWFNSVKFNEDFLLTATFRQLNITLKCMEMVSHLPIETRVELNEIRDCILAAFKQAGEYAKFWEEDAFNKLMEEHKELWDGLNMMAHNQTDTQTEEGFQNTYNEAFKILKKIKIN